MLPLQRKKSPKAKQCPKSNTSSGHIGEVYASKLLESKGYEVITRNFRSKFGELDLVCLDKDTLVFVEVKTRWSNKFGKPEEAVTPKKLSNIARAGEYFWLLHPTLPKKFRIDVVALEVRGGKVVSEKIINV